MLAIAAAPSSFCDTSTAQPASSGVGCSKYCVGWAGLARATVGDSLSAECNSSRDTREFARPIVGSDGAPDMLIASAPEQTYESAHACIYRGLPKFWTYSKVICVAVCDLGVRKKNWCAASHAFERMYNTLSHRSKT